ncbi:MAG: aspartate carbamoyltransferase catalytic subunit [Acidobacteriota bacterium]
MVLTTKHLLGTETLPLDDIHLILKTARSFREVATRPIKKVPALRGKTVINLFFEPSTRTRSSFEIAAKRLSADSVNVSASGSSVAKGETLIDTARNLESMSPDVIVIRHGCSGAPHLLARYCKAPIVNAGDGMHEHPTQALLDAFTILEHKKAIAGLKVAIIGDIRHSRVARSNVWLLRKLGAEVVLCGPPTMMPPGLSNLGADVTYDMNRALEKADVVIMLRIQLERQEEVFFPSVREYFREFGLSRDKLQVASRDVLVMHPGPMNRGVEISSDVADGAESVILEQVTNGVAVRMAILFLLAAGPEETEAMR